MHTSKSASTRQRAFAALETVIALIILVLLIGAYLQGRQMMLNRQLASIENDCEFVAMAIEKYHKAYGFLPGDDPGATTRFDGVWSASDDGDGDGRISGLWNSSDNSSETRLFWKHLRAAELIAGPVDTSDASYAQPNNGFDGLIGVGHGIYNLEGLNVVFGDMPGKVLHRFDERADDGSANSGRVRARTDGSEYIKTRLYDGAVALETRGD